MRHAGRSPACRAAALRYSLSPQDTEGADLVLKRKIILALGRIYAYAQLAGIGALYLYMAHQTWGVH
jgi:hypothetical protein